MANIGDLLMQVAMQKRKERLAAKAQAQPAGGGVNVPPGAASTPLQAGPPDMQGGFQEPPMRPGPPEQGAGFGRSGAQIPGNRPIPGVNDSSGSPVMQGGGMSDDKRMAMISAIRGMAPQAPSLAAPQPPAASAPPPPVAPGGTPPPPMQPPQVAQLNQPPLDPGMQLPPQNPGSSVGGLIENPAAMQGAGNEMMHIGGEAGQQEPPLDFGTSPPLNVSMPPPGGKGGMQTSGEDQIGQYIAQQQMEQMMMQQSRSQQEQIVEEMMRRRMAGGA